MKLALTLLESIPSFPNFNFLSSFYSQTLNQGLVKNFSEGNYGKYDENKRRGSLKGEKRWKGMTMVVWATWVGRRR